MAEFFEKINEIVWGLPALVGILGVGLYLTVRTGFVQIRLFPKALRRFFGMFSGRNQSSFRGLCTALGATVGTGNLVGVAGAICLGGPGSIFWMWVCGFLGMATKYAEAVLAIRYRDGDRGGPMYYISQGMGQKWHWLACIYSFFGITAAFGVGNATQINALVMSVQTISGRKPGILCCMGLSLAVGFLLAGGAKRIGAAAEKLVPVAAGGYILLCVAILFLRSDRIGHAFSQIFRGVLDPNAVTGGVFGSVFSPLRVGCARGVFTNEAGMGTAGIAHGCAEVKHPAEQGMMGIMEVFLDTIVICTLTALVILCSGVPIPYGTDIGGELTTVAFSALCGDWVGIFLCTALCCFALATILGWGLYGLRCGGFLLGKRSEKWFVVMATCAAFLGAMLGSGVIWTLAEILNGLMAIPNLLALCVLSGEIGALTQDYLHKIRKSTD